MPDTEITELPTLFLNTKGVRQSEVGMTDHPENETDSPRDHRFRHDVGDRPDVRFSFMEGDVDAVVSYLHRIRGDAVVVATRWLPGKGLVIPSVPGTTEVAFFDGALT